MYPSRPYYDAHVNIHANLLPKMRLYHMCYFRTCILLNLEIGNFCRDTDVENKRKGGKLGWWWWWDELGDWD